MSPILTSDPRRGEGCRRASARGIVAALAALLLVAWPATPASAEPPVTLFASPGDGEVVTVANPVIAGEVRMTNGILLEDVVIEVVSKWDHPGASTVVPARAMPSQTFSFSPTLTHNGPYQAIVSATGKDIALDIRTDTAVVSRSFSLAVPPEAPSDVSASVDSRGRTVTLSWKPNPEPDIIGYQLRRSRGAGQRGSVVGTTSDTTFVDNGTTSAGGDYVYRVYAVRVGASAESGIMSVPSSPVTAVVPDPLGRASVPRAAPGAGAAGSGSPTSAVPGEPAAVDLSQFRALVAEEDDINTEYGTGIPGSDQPVLPEGVEPSAALPDEQALDRSTGEVVYERVARARSPAETRRSLAFLAAGLLAGVLALAGLWLKREVDRSPPVA